MNATEYIAARQNEATHGTYHLASPPAPADDLPIPPAEPLWIEETDLVAPELPQGTLPLVELILKDRRQLERLVREPAFQGELIPRFLAIAVVGFAFFGVVTAVMLCASRVWPELTPVAGKLHDPSLPLIDFRPAADESPVLSPWTGGAAINLILAYTVGLIAATGVCLPSLYFYALLSGIRMSMLDVTVHALKSKSVAAVALVGILPVYLPIIMGMVIFDAPAPILNASLWLGLILPFIAGLWGNRSLYVGFSGLANTIRAERRDRRACFLRRLVLSWTAAYTAVTPVMIFTLWEYFQR